MTSIGGPSGSTERETVGLSGGNSLMSEKYCAALTFQIYSLEYLEYLDQKRFLSVLLRQVLHTKRLLKDRYPFLTFM